LNHPMSSLMMNRMFGLVLFGMQLFSSGITCSAASTGHQQASARQRQPVASLWFVK
jgi:hypothetical protein